MVVVDGIFGVYLLWSGIFGVVEVMGLGGGYGSWCPSLVAVWRFGEFVFCLAIVSRFLTSVGLVWFCCYRTVGVWCWFVFVVVRLVC